jgi:putative NADPH-quinone reductase
MPQLLILYAHPDQPASRINRHLRDQACLLPNTEVRDLYRLYPRGIVDRRKEQEALLRADIIVSQYPLFWYSMPPLLKEWVDTVLEYGWAYGPNGNKLAGKSWLHCVSTGGDAYSYTKSGAHGYRLEDFLRPQEMTARLCHTRWLTPFVTHDAMRVQDDALHATGERYCQHLQQINHARARLPS